MKPDQTNLRNIITEAEEIELYNIESQFLNCADLFDTTPPEQEFLFAPIFPAIGICAVAGSSDTGKSAMLRQMAFCVASGQDFLGFQHQAKKRNVIIVSTEDNRDDFNRLMRIQNNSLNLKREDFTRIQLLFDADDIVNTLKTRLDSCNDIGLIVVDAFSDVFAIMNENDMNNGTAVRRVLNEFSKMANEYKVCICFLHHTTKSAKNNAPDKNNLSGSQGFEAKMRLVIELRPDAEDDYKKHFCIVKGNYLKPEYKRQSYELNFCDLVFTATGERTDLSELKADEYKGTQKKSKDSIQKESFRTILQGNNNRFRDKDLKREYLKLTGVSERTYDYHKKRMFEIGFIEMQDDKFKLTTD